MSINRTIAQLKLVEQRLAKTKLKIEDSIALTEDELDLQRATTPEDVHRIIDAASKYFDRVGRQKAAASNNPDATSAKLYSDISNVLKTAADDLHRIADSAPQGLSPPPEATPETPPEEAPPEGGEAPPEGGAAPPAGGEETPPEGGEEASPEGEEAPPEGEEEAPPEEAPPPPPPKKGAKK